MERITLVLLPGLDGTGDLFDPLISALGSTFSTRIIRYPLNEALGYQELEERVRLALPTSESFVLLGESFSGPIAASISATPPKNMVGVVLCCTFITNPRPFLAGFGWLVRMATPNLAPLAVTSKILMGSDCTYALRSALSAALKKVSASAFQARLRAILAVDVSTQLATARIPVMYLQATRDILVPASASKRIMDVQPATTVESIDGPHFLLQTRPAQAAVSIAKFVRSIKV